MVNRSLTVKKLMFYITITAIALTIGKGANAQIVYAPLNPNFTGYDTTCLLDLNGERIIDFTINPDSGIYAGQDSTMQFLSPIVIQHEDSLWAEPGKNSKFPPKITFQWYNENSTAISGADSIYFVPNTSGYYYVEVTDSSESVSVLSEVFQFALTDLTPLNSTDDINVSESNNLLRIKFINEPYYGYQLAIYNYTGQKVFSYEINSINTIANLRPLNKGLYFASVEKGNKRIVKKIIIG